MKLREPWTCIFCNGYRVSDEHFWPLWCHPLFKRGAHDSHRQFRDDIIPGHGVKRRNERNKHGHLVTKTIHCVCKPCNNGWMSEVETKAKRVMLPMAFGEALTLSSDDAYAIANWITLKVMVCEQDDPRLALTPANDRLLFKENRAIPRYYRIRIGRNASGWRVGFLRQSLALSYSATPTPVAPMPVPPLGGLRKNAQCVSILLGAIYIHASAVRLDGLDLDNVIVHKDWGPRIWPHEEREIAWPPERALSKRDINVLAYALDRLKQNPRYRWGGFLDAVERAEWEGE